MTADGRGLLSCIIVSHDVLHGKDRLRFVLAVAKIEQIKTMFLSGHDPAHIAEALNINGETTLRRGRL